MVLQSFLSQLSSTSRRHGLELLHAVEVMLAFMHAYENEITRFMIDASVWVVEYDVRNCLRSIFKVVLAPAFNAAIAHRLSGTCLRLIDR